MSLWLKLPQDVIVLNKVDEDANPVLFSASVESAAVSSAVLSLSAVSFGFP